MRYFRPSILLAIFFILGAAILSRLAFLQIEEHGFYKAMAEGQQKTLEPINGERGEVFFRNGEPLGINETSKYLFVSPREIKEKTETARVLAEISGIEEKTLLGKIQENNLFELIKKNITKEEENLIKEKGLKGVYLADELVRSYPQNESASHIIGFVGGENKGQYGVEGFYDEVLRGKEVLTEKERGPFGFFVSQAQESAGQNLVLTIDRRIQFEAESLLKEAYSVLNFESAQILVIDPLSGEILTLAQFPSFDPNKYSEIEDQEIFKNSAIQEIFEPGSIFKPIVMSAAINEGKVTPQTTYVDEGIVRIGGWKVYNYDQRTWGEQTMTGVLEKSINTGAVFAEKELGNSLFLDYLEKFGFFEKTGVEVQGEVASENQELKKGYEINFITAAFGQGIEITPIQLVKAIAAIANGGKLINPHLIKEGPREKKVEEEIISKETASQVATMMVSVIENGYGKSARINGYYLAGKTGTAQVAWSALGIPKSGYSDKTVQSFIGFGPAFNPRFLILVKLDNPQAKTAEYSAAPIFKNLAKFIIDYYQIPPDYE